MRIIPWVFMLAILLPAASFSGAQQHSMERDRDSATQVAFDYLTEDARARVLLARQFPQTRLLERTQDANHITLRLEHEGHPLEITTMASGQIEVVLSQDFSANDIDGIAEHHPELLKHVRSFPKSIGGGLEVELTIHTKVRKKLDSKYHLQLRHPDIYEIYEAFRRAPHDNRIAAAGNGQ
ncbi:MAG: hypothetical protein ACR2NP_09635 [Pirellulaceae bacterium]